MKKVIRIVVAVASTLAVLLATATAHACIPFFIYQPEAPKSLIKED
ncbi:MAG TPA: cyclic lactone autoinducer peptide [Clostridiaceae bacterium]|nr:cyclic lactone autoinducer peptide [Clostridiaceae bacterium]